MEDDVLHQLNSDETFNPFLDDKFDVKAHANKTIQGIAIGEQLAKLTDGMAILDKEIHNQIVDHHEDLLSQATGVETLEGVLQMMQSRIQSLLSAMERIRCKVSDPFNKIVMRTAQLRRLQEACDLLRRIIRILYLSKRLRSQLEGGAREITKAAQSLNELDYVCEGMDLSGIEVIEADRRFIKQARKDVEAQAQKMLEQGMETQNQSQVATSLQVFYNLNSLSATVKKVVNNCRETLHQNVKNCLNMQLLQQQLPSQGQGGPGRALMPVTGNTAAYRANLWTNMEKLMDNIYAACAQIQHLQKVLTKKRDPVTHICFIEELSKTSDEPINIMQDFWESVTSILTDEFKAAARDTSFLKQAFEGEYPKLLRLYNDLWKRLHQFNVTSNTATSVIHTDFSAIESTDDDFFSQKAATKTGYDSEMALRNTLASFETAYLSRSLSRLFDPINLVFTSGSLNPPTKEEVDSIVKTIASELNVASVDTKLSVTVARNVTKTVKLFCVKSEQLLTTDGEASQVIRPATPGQIRNAVIVNTLYQFHVAVSKVISGLNFYPSEALENLNESLKDVVMLMSSGIQPLLSSISDALEAIILTIHQEDFSGDAPTSTTVDAPCSLYMKELQSFIARARTDYLSQYTCADFIFNSINGVCCRCIELFVRHACLIRPLGDGGKMKLASDFAQMESALSPFCHRPSDLGRPYRLLRAFRPLLFQSSEHISRNPVLGDVIPYSLVLSFLFARAPAELTSPHQNADWSVSYYSQWLDNHTSEKDRLTFIKGALEAYVQQVKCRQGKKFADIYPVMLELLQQGLQQAT
ncbi:conserved oligomeric Golgi complex subunit 5 [Octopus vulgaris]|uniref:Conserved oligomeric Golgi complex subunit 5 n=2 Tax=Octopus TaxID=6643 RepID=A0AA36AQT6_OCTVU|nr:conserved oligomeric Golgi complex subunit 5 [Octopus sinensis]CAI9719984.1 conserved oligomeric Golgi complex subunit 5 [Octopus vulgaris]